MPVLYKFAAFHAYAWFSRSDGPFCLAPTVLRSLGSVGLKGVEGTAFCDYEPGFLVLPRPSRFWG